MNNQKSFSLNILSNLLYIYYSVAYVVNVSVSTATLGIMALSITTLGISTLSIKGTIHNITQYAVSLCYALLL
jgi:hypothetical protein